MNQPKLPPATYKKITAAIAGLLFALFGEKLGLSEENIQQAVWTAWILIGAFASQDIGKEGKKLDVLKAYYEAADRTQPADTPEE